MITKIGRHIHLDTASTTLVLRVDENKHLLCEYYGPRLPISQDYAFLTEKTAFPHGSEIVFDAENKTLSLDNQCLEIATHGKGDFREPSLIIQSEHSQVLDFIYASDETLAELPLLDGLPIPHGVSQVLQITLIDNVSKLKMLLNYGVYEAADVISRSAILINESAETVTIDKIMSLQLDMINDDFDLVNLYGGWAAENHQSKTKLRPGIFINDSKTGNSSNRHNALFMLVNQKAGLNTGRVYGFNLLYSGNHYEMTEVTSYGKIRVQIGINPFLFHIKLEPNQRFETPVAVMSVSDKGQNGLTHNMHRFVNNHIVRGPWANKDRPILLNNWEATYLKFNEGLLLSLLRKAKDIGIELFVLDDGWFSTRNDDTQGLGDYDVNYKKLPRGLSFLADKANDAGLKFGLWFEPEMVNENSDLFRAHPDWAITCPERTPSLGRNQLVLDLSRYEVQAYLIESISRVLDSAHIEYVKWDMNRHITDFVSSHYRQGELYHRYIQGLYRVMTVLTHKYDYVLWEGCSSGGNRFDLGMLCYFQQNWTSDDTDAYERLKIQSGTALGYPLSAMTCHVAASPSHQALRKIPLGTRFNVAMFGNLGYELDIRQLDEVDEAEVRAQIAFYKKHRRLLQYGRFYQLKKFEDDRYVSWMVVNDDHSEALIGYFNGLQSLLPSVDTLLGYGFDEQTTYEVKVLPQGHRIKLFGGLINQVSPIRLRENGVIVNWLDRHKTIEELMKAKQTEHYIVSGAALNNGAVKLLPQWAGNGYNENVRVLADFGSQIYHVVRLEQK